MSVEYDDEIAKEFESLLAESRDPTATLASEHQYRSESAPPTVAAALSHIMSPPGFPSKRNHNPLRSDKGGMLLRSADDADTHTSLFSSSSQPIWQYKRVASSSSGFPAWQPNNNHVHRPSIGSRVGNSMLGLGLDLGDKHTNHLQDGIGASQYFSSKNSKNLFGCRQDESLASSDNVNCLSQDPFVKEHHFSRSQTPPPSQISSLESLSTNFSYLGGRYSAVDNSKISRHEIPSKASCGINGSSDLRFTFSNLSLASTRNLATCDAYDNLETQNQALALENARSEVVGYSKVQRTQAELMSSVSSPQTEKPLIYAEDGIHHRNYKMPLDPPLSQVNDASMWKFSKPMTSEIYVPTFSALCNDKLSTGEVQTGFKKNGYMPGHGSGGKLPNPMISSVNSNFAVNDSNSYLFDETAAMKIASNSMNCKSRANEIDENLYKSFVHMERLGKLSHEGRHVAQLPNLTPAEIQYMQRLNGFPVNMDANFVGASMNGGYCTGSSSNLLEIQKLLYMQQKSQCSRPSTRKGSLVDIEYLCNSNFGPYMPYTKIPGQTPIQLSSHVMPHAKQYDRNSHNFSFNGSVGGTIGLCRSENRTGMLEKNGSSLLEEFKSNKNRNFQLSEIVGHVVEFSTDQFGSRFIQQKLETAPVEEKNTIFQEIFPESLDLMKDVFGNYVIQKFFEHGTVTQRRDLANQLSGHVLDLSLQMYGCRVIQKAIEVVETDQQERLVLELDGHIMRCVLDQNGNHVIQKGIECIPQEKIHFIISSFFGRVPELSSHAYGCRVIQRVLEHYNHEQTQNAIFEEILQAACTLAKDQYGNYVVQHVLGHGKPHERSAIIKKLAGQIVQMSHQKFASNVIEKCLEFGGPAERQILINEILGSTDDNEPLQAMMKDQYGNYVVQKALDTCDDQQRASILSRVKAHITALKKYTYGKHIVSHVEKLVAGGYM